MINNLNTKINIRLFISLIFGIALLISCGGGGGGGGGSSPSTPSSPTFTITTIDNTGDVGWNSDLAIGPTGSIHISYYDYTNGSLKYAYNNGILWNTVTVDSSVDVGDYSLSMAVDSNDTVHISYYDYDNGYLQYATCAGTSDCTQSGNWTTETVDNSADVGMYSSVAVESDGTVHISYYNWDNGDLRYATNAGVTTGDGNCFIGSNFNCEIVDSSADFYGYSSIAVESDGTVHISYYDSTNGDLKYTTGTSGAFNTPETVDNSSTVGEYPSIAVESDGTVHISYYDSTNGDLKYTTGTSGAFNTPEVVDSSGNVGEYTSIAVGASGTVHISYHDIDTDTLKYASGTAGSFTIETVDDSITTGEYSSIAVEPDGTVHISYYDYIDLNSGHLKYAVK